MLKWEEQMKIKFLVGRGHSIRETARLTGHAHWRGARGFAGQDGRKRNRNGNPWPKVKACGFQGLSTGKILKTGLSGTRLAEEIRQMGFAGSVSAVRRFLQTVDREEISPKATVRFETPPGDRPRLTGPRSVTFWTRVA
jgi:hypothetical protein